MNYTLILILFCIITCVLGLLSRSKNKTSLEFNFASGKLNWIKTAFSSAATWIWAPALFVSSERAYADGLIGFGWFFVPNVLSLILFGYVAKRAIEKRNNDEYSVAELIAGVYKSKRLEFLHTFELLILLFCSTGVQLLAGGLALVFLTGLNFLTATIIMASTVLIYSLVNGIRASVNSDVVKMILMLLTVIIAPIILLQTGGLNFGGIKSMPIGFFSSYNWEIFLLFGLTTTIGLLSGPLADQTFWQRAFGLGKKNIVKSFTLSAFIFAIVPVAIGLIGFTAASSGFIPTDVSMVGLEYIKNIAPTFLVVLFMLAILSGLMSTIDSNICAMGSISSKWFSKERSLKSSRIGMIIVLVFGLLVANIPGIKIFWLFLFYGVFRSSVFMPTLFTILSKKIPSERSVFWGMLSAFLIGVPIYCYGAIEKVGWAKVWGTLLTILLPLTIILISKYKEKYALRKRVN